MEALIFRAKGKGTITVCVGETSEEALERDDKKLEQIPTAACGFARRGQCHHFAGPCFQIMFYWSVTKELRLLPFVLMWHCVGRAPDAV